MRAQNILYADDNYTVLDKFLAENKTNKIFLVADNSLSYLKIAEYFERLEKTKTVIRFNDFKPNPLYESVVKGVELFKKEKCDIIIAVGGGSAMDVAKCVKLYSGMDNTECYLKQKIVPNGLPFLAVPTTAGSGSEATKYAVIYYNGEKQSVTDESCIPTDVLFDYSVLKTLPPYQKKSTMLDALCHAIESFWSVNSTSESKEYSRQTIDIILKNYKRYLDNDDEACKQMLKAANTAGKAINITQTTAGHAMCYKLTGMFNIPHGSAAALCVAKLWKYMVLNTDKCIDKRGEAYLKDTFKDLAECFGCNSSIAAIDCFKDILARLEINPPESVDESDYRVLTKSVNLVRLKNNPISLDESAINELYHEILKR